MTALQALPAHWRGWLAYDRTLVSDGQVWRLLTSNVIHLGWGHLILNSAGLLVIAWLFAADRPTSGWAIDLVICALATATGVYVLNPEIPWCVGLSGVLHGLFVIGAVGCVTAGMSEGKWLLLGISAKLVWEHFVGETPLTGEIVGGAIVTDAHLWGSLGGLVAVAIDRLWRRLGARL
jgi:rhomboid family GlyGly-CTERM serine protease